MDAPRFFQIAARLHVYDGAVAAVMRRLNHQHHLQSAPESEPEVDLVLPPLPPPPPVPRPGPAAKPGDRVTEVSVGALALTASDLMDIRKVR